MHNRRSDGRSGRTVGTALYGHLLFLLAAFALAAAGVLATIAGPLQHWPLLRREHRNWSCNGRRYGARAHFPAPIPLYTAPAI
jgi:UPF0716 family protein affecting phage T7 exclusion